MNEKAEVDCGCVSCAALLVAFLFSGRYLLAYQ